MKRKPRDAYNPAIFMDKSGYAVALNRLEKQYEGKK
jgi:hypothetical protein